MNAISVDRVTFTYPGAPAPTLLDCTLSIPEGSFVLVAGPTGAGKSTLLRSFNGLVPHFTGGTWSGRVIVDGRDTRDHPPRRLADAVGFVPQDPSASFVVDRVEDELAYVMENLGVAPSAMRRSVEEMLDLLGIEPLRERSVRTLSGGERQRVAIAAALTAGPRILVLDEPTSQLDPQGAEDVLAALQRLVHDLGLTVVLAEHRLERVAGFADLALVCRAGVAPVAGAPEDVLAGLDLGPPVMRLGRLVGWVPPPLTVRDARRAAPDLRLEGAPGREREVHGDRLLQARKLAAAYARNVVLRGLDLAISSGEIVALLGRNGAGKTTLLRCLSGLHEPAAGTVLAADGAPRPGIDAALCPQDPEVLLFKDRVLDEIAATTARRPRVDQEEILSALALDSLADRHPRDVSVGQRLLVALAATVATGAPVLLLDEPTRGLDLDGKRRLTAFMRSHAKRSGAVVFATHDVELVAEVAERVVLLAGGEIIADGSPSEVLGDSPVFAPQMSRVFGNGWLTPEQVAAAVIA